MIEHISFILLCTLVTLLEVTAHYIYSLLKMTEANLNDLLPELPYDPLKSDVKQQKHIEYVLIGNRKQYLGKTYTKEQIKKLSAEEVDKLFSNYEAKLSDQTVMSLGKSIIKMYSMGACAV